MGFLRPGANDDYQPALAPEIDATYQALHELKLAAEELLLVFDAIHRGNYEAKLLFAATFQQTTGIELRGVLDDLFCLRGPQRLGALLKTWFDLLPEMVSEASELGYNRRTPLVRPVDAGMKTIARDYMFLEGKAAARDGVDLLVEELCRHVATVRPAIREPYRFPRGGANMTHLYPDMRAAALAIAQSAAAPDSKCPYENLLIAMRKIRGGARPRIVH